MSGFRFPFPYTSTPNVFTVYLKGRPHAISKQSTAFESLKAAIDAGEELTEDDVLALVSPRRTLSEAGVEGITVEGNLVYFNGERLHDVLSARILNVMRDGFPLDSWRNLVANIWANPAPWAKSEIFLWMEANNLPHTPDGHILAYKRVRHDYLSCHAGVNGRLDYSVGNVVEMPREQVDPVRAHECSTGLHFCSYDYLPFFGGERVVVVKINPADIVSIPHDYNNTKGRCWRMEVVDELPLHEVLGEEPSWPSVVEHVVIHEDAPDEPEAADGDVLTEEVDDMIRFHEEVRTNGHSIAEEAEQHLADIAEATDPKRSRRKAPAKAKKAAPKKPPRYPVVESKVAGRITKARYKELVKEHGGPSGIAEHFGISAGVVRGWKKKLGL